MRSIALTSVLAFFVAAPAVFAQEAQAPLPTQPVPALPTGLNDAPAEEPKVTLEEIFVVPEGKKPEELLVFLQEAQRRGIKAALTPMSTEEEVEAFKVKFAGFMVKIADKMIAAAPADELLEQAYHVKMVALSMLAQGDAEKTKDLVAYVETLKTLDKFPELVAQGKALLIVQKILPLQKMEAKDVPLDQLTAIQADVKALLTESPSPEIAGLAMELVEFIQEIGEAQGKPELGSAAREDFVKFFLESKEPGLQQLGKMLEAQGLRALGKTIDLAGITVDGKEFDWKSYRGKHVLIVFWASWCQPCAEFYPYILRAYETYKDKGFDVVGIGYDDTTEALKESMSKSKMPWAVISDEATLAKKMPGLSDTFGIEGVPTIFLVDKDAKVVLEDGLRADLLEQIGKALGIETPEKGDGK